MKLLSALRPRELLKVLDLCTTFFLDAAVLVFVFPILDTVVQHGGQELTPRLFFGTLAISGVFFVLAIVMGIMMARREVE
ncbi:MAG TPA: hypothetical protein VN822_00655 [Candidatus Acidoferrales bacterium]|nr:hypothetical protein [Candidatus Acidoferrales bacterium]